MASPVKRRATHEDLSQVPPHRVAEVYRLADGRWLLLATHEGAARRAEPFDAVELDLMPLPPSARPGRYGFAAATLMTRYCTRRLGPGHGSTGDETAMVRLPDRLGDVTRREVLHGRCSDRRLAGRPNQKEPGKQSGVDVHHALVLQS
jgi:hypothetical protein